MLKPSLFQIKLASSWISENVLHSAPSGTLFLQFFFLTTGPTAPCPTPLWWDIYWSTSCFSIIHPECGNCNMHWNMEQFRHTMWLTASHSCKTFHTIYYRLYSFFCVVYIYTGECGGTVVKVLCYKSGGRWFNPRWCHWIFHWHNPSDRTMALGSTQPLTDMRTWRISWG